MNEILQTIAQAYQVNPWPTLWGSLTTLWVGSIIGTQLINWGMAWIDDAKKVRQNQVLKRFFKLFGEDYYGEDAVFFGAFFGMIAVGIPLIATAIHFIEISIWLMLAWCVAYAARSARRVQKKLQKHIEDKEAHK